MEEVVKPVGCFIAGSTRVICLNCDPIQCKGIELDVLGDGGHWRILQNFRTKQKETEKSQ